MRLLLPYPTKLMCCQNLQKHTIFSPSSLCFRIWQYQQSYKYFCVPAPDDEYIQVNLLCKLLYLLHRPNKLFISFLDRTLFYLSHHSEVLLLIF